MGKLGIDLDEVLAGTIDGVLKFSNENYGTNHTREDVRQYFFAELWNVSEQEERTRFEEFFESEHFGTIVPMPGAVEAISRLQKRWKITIITSRPQKREQVTREWLRQYFPELDTVHFGNGPHAGSRVSKAEICRKLGIDVYVDDADFHVHEVAPAVRHAFLFDAPWNRDSTGFPDNVMRVHSWKQLEHTLSLL